MSWSNPRTFVAGEIVTAAMLNQHLRDQLNFLATFLSTGTLGTNSVLLGAGTGAVGTLTLPAFAIPMGSSGAQPTAIVAFAGASPALSVVRSLFGGLQADVSAGTKGAILVGSATGVYNALTRGSDGQQLQADSTQVLGIKWGNAGTASIIVSGSGTIAIVDSGASLISTGTINGLALQDYIQILYEIEKTGSAIGSGDIAFQITFSTGTGTITTGTVAAILGSAARTFWSGFLTVTRGNGGVSTARTFHYSKVNSGSGTITPLFYENLSMPTAWTGSFVIGLFGTGMNGDASTGTFNWRWTVYKQIGT